MLLPNLRTSIVEFRLALPDSLTLYWGQKQDLDEETLLRAAASVRSLRVRDILWLLATPPRVLEVVEPLYARAWPQSWALAALVRVSAFLQRRRMNVVVFAIENLPADNVLDLSRTKGFRWLRLGNRGLRRLWAWSTLIVTRVVYGSEASQENYVRAGLLTSAEVEIVCDLPSPCGCSSIRPKAGALTDVLFLGEFTARKGVCELLQGWPAVRRALPDARLTLVGFGELAQTVRQFAAREGHRVITSPPRTEIHALLANADVLALPSQPVQGWREQIGLPICEGLAHGCRIVTTTETGLAWWLRNHGHQVCETSSSEAVADAVVAALRAGPSAASVLASLPAESGRIQAQKWLYA